MSEREREREGRDSVHVIPISISRIRDATEQGTRDSPIFQNILGHCKFRVETFSFGPVKSVSCTGPSTIKRNPFSWSCTVGIRRGMGRNRVINPNGARQEAKLGLKVFTLIICFILPPSVSNFVYLGCCAVRVCLMWKLS